MLRMPQDRDPLARPSGPAAAGHMAVSTMAAGVTGGVSGFFGLAALPVELPVTTTLMLRAIADIARHNGEDLSTARSAARLPAGVRAGSRGDRACAPMSAISPPARC